MDDPHRIEHGPPAEAYSRVTNAERFRPLLAHALDTCAMLRATYDVTVSPAFELLPGLMQPFEHARPPVALTPASPRAAPVSVAFTSFPGLVVRCGRWHAARFPNCGCDACAESAAGEMERFDALVRRVVAGELAEELRVPWWGSARLYHSFPAGTRAPAMREEGWTTVPRAVARVLAAGGPRRICWQPWPQQAK